MGVYAGAPVRERLFGCPCGCLWEHPIALPSWGFIWVPV